MLIVYLEKRLARVVVELEGRTVLTRDVADVNPAVTAIITLILYRTRSIARKALVG